MLFRSRVPRRPRKAQPRPASSQRVSSFRLLSCRTPLASARPCRHIVAHAGAPRNYTKEYLRGKLVPRPVALHERAPARPFIGPVRGGAPRLEPADGMTLVAARLLDAELVGARDGRRRVRVEKDFPPNSTETVDPASARPQTVGCVPRRF